MGCACGKNKSTGLNAKRQEKAAEAKTRAAREADARSQTSTSRLSPNRPGMSGTTQSFSLQIGGKTARLGSRLERDAAAARLGDSQL